MIARPSDQFIGSSDDTITGCEWVVDAIGCAGERLKTLPILEHVCDQIITDLGLQVIGNPLWHQFPQPGGITGMFLLSESHLTCHTWPEHGLATFNLFCCRKRREWNWQGQLRNLLLAETVSVQSIERGRILSGLPGIRATGGSE